MEYEQQRADGVTTFYALDVVAWRAWLTEHHQNVKSVWLIIYRKDSGTPSITYPEAVDEALCFGWIDSKPNKRDEDSFYQYFSKRKAKSNWSRVNKEKIARLEKAGKLAPAGWAMVELAKSNGTWTALDAVENLIVPPDLQVAFEQYPGSTVNWEAFPRSAKRGILEWILNAKRPETRAKRIAETARLAQQNERANQYRKQ
ncbi:MAG: YdeI/OmpD-associated family protein [Bacteroidota bacterium]